MLLRNAIACLLFAAMVVWPWAALAEFYRYVTEDGEVFYVDDLSSVPEQYQQQVSTALPDYFVTALELDYVQHIKMQAVLQKHVDAAVSKTINMKNIFHTNCHSE